MPAMMIEMDDGAQLRTWIAGSMIPQRLPVVMVHGGPGVPDYLAPVAGIIDEMCLVHRYDQRGTGGSTWEGAHTIARHIHDLALLLDAWGHDRVVLMGHSFGTNLASYFMLAHPQRVAGLIQIAGPFLDPWREACRAAERARRSDEQQARLDELDANGSRTDAEEIEYLTLSWFTDHADRDRALDWALAAARTQRPVNYVMNSQLNAAKKADPLESHVDELRERLPPGAVIIGGAGDTRPADALRRLGARLNCEVIIIPDAGHDPWLEAPGQFSAVLRAVVKRQRPSRACSLSLAPPGLMTWAVNTYAWTRNGDPARSGNRRISEARSVSNSRRSSNSSPGALALACPRTWRPRPSPPRTGSPRFWLLGIATSIESFVRATAIIVPSGLIARELTLPMAW